MFSTPEGFFSLSAAAAAATLQQRLHLKKAARCILIAKPSGLVVRDVRCDFFFFFFKVTTGV